MTTKWDLRFLQMAKLVGSWSKDPSSKVGAIIVRGDKTIHSVGFNGFPKRMEDKQEWYYDREEKLSRVIHAEVNALLHADGPVRGFSLFTYPFCPCDRCAVQMIQAGIERFVFPAPTSEIFLRWGASFATAKKYFAEANIPYTEVTETI